ncbi:MAG: ABC transporter ATP-binding protein [Tractidigestivibacter sp.]|jgi:ABC-type polysaccharide/polyol phosphate transport system ATPase subunit|uniref:ABC transporter ATP-binding protein n=1 Tax=Tractidigestivibacter sp. TaxID=2847320 RepID=UPI003D91FAB2
MPEFKPSNWVVTMKVSQSQIRVGESVTVTPHEEGPAVPDQFPPECFEYDYMWARNDMWKDGTWESTLHAHGERTKAKSWTFTPDRPGYYHLFVNAQDPDGFSMSADKYVLVVSESDFMRPSLPTPDQETVIDVDNVVEIFNIASEQYNSLKEYFIALMKHELSFKEFRALDGISFQVKHGEAFGLVGTNGSGKSTMLKIIAGVLEPTTGTCKVRGTIAPLIELGAGFDMELTAKENIYLNGALLGYRKEFIDEHFQDIVDFAELEGFMDMPLKNYSSGMVARIAFAIATVTEPDILIVDETLSVGDFLFQQKCERRIKELVSSNNVTVLLVSHSIDLVRRICDRVCWIEKGKQRMLGPTDEVCDAYEHMAE